MSKKKAVDVLLVLLILLDVVYDFVIFLSAETWFRVMHGLRPTAPLQMSASKKG